MYAERIKQIRQALNLSVAKLAQKINIPPRTITGYERKERTPSIEFAAQCCTILNINANWFLTGKGEMFNRNEINTNPDLRNEVLKILKDEGFMK